MIFLTRKGAMATDTSPLIGGAIAACLGRNITWRTSTNRGLIPKLGFAICGLVAAVLTATPGLGAERIAFFYPPFGEFSLSREDLEVFVKEGKITKDFNFYTRFINPQQLTQLRDVLSRRFEVSPILVSQFTYSPVGETVLRRLGEVFQTDSRHNGFYALRSAFILAAADPEGLTFINILRRFPTYSVRLNLNRGLAVAGTLSELLKKRDVAIGAIKQEAAAEVSNSPSSVHSQPDLRHSGSFLWRKETLALKDSKRDRAFPVDVYLPQLKQCRGVKCNASTPVIVISHGVAEDRTSFIYLAEHLASYGFAVAVLEHPGINSQRFQEYFAGLVGPPEPRELIDQPLDVKYLLDELQRLQKTNPPLWGLLNLQQVGAIGHSQGGYSVLALAGAKIDFKQLRKDCTNQEFLNMSLLVQCRAAELPAKVYPLQDERVKAVLAVNPLASSILGQSGVSQIQTPSMLVAGSEDIVTPAVPEQIRPFAWLNAPNKYLVVIENGTHFSTVGEASSARSVLPVPTALIGPNPELARSYLKALSVAFFQTHIANQPEYSSYLNTSYANSISQAPLNLILVQSLNPSQLEQLLNKATAKPSGFLSDRLSLLAQRTSMLSKQGKRTSSFAITLKSN